ncbi:MAG: dihydrodipicolinate synthase family protein, partial [Actinobacteria bacterium]|nr:dihydrodipicolinate synthase family protein [Actinomycetota bacterium]
MIFGELITAMVTPFDKNYNLDQDAALKMMEHLVKNGSDG